MTNQSKSYSCDVETGTCDTVVENHVEEIQIPQTKKVTLIYYTDPICSACWAIEPALKKFKLEYGDFVKVDYKMGGLLPGWEGFADKANGISKPSDVSHHWDEVGQNSGMSIDGDVWLQDPLSSSYPPSIAVKAMQKQSDVLALQFLRRIREMVFLEKKNITKEVHLIKAVTDCGGDSTQFLQDYHNPLTAQAFYTEIQDGRNLGVRGFPTFIFVDETGNGLKISGMSSYENYITALEKVYGETIEPKKIKLNELELLKKYSYMATREIAFVLSQSDHETEKNLEVLVSNGVIEKVPQKYGNFWKIII